jgi:hypothetical protein
LFWFHRQIRSGVALKNILREREKNNAGIASWQCLSASAWKKAEAPDDASA